jgi:hypothetical protein
MPRSMQACATCEPINPAAPVTYIRVVGVVRDFYKVVQGCYQSNVAFCHVILNTARIGALIGFTALIIQTGTL